MVLLGPNNRAYSDGDTLGCAVIGNQRVRARHVPALAMSKINQSLSSGPATDRYEPNRMEKEAKGYNVRQHRT
jgi:hypothetical protein